MSTHKVGVSLEPFAMEGLLPQVQLLMRLQSHALRRRAELKACERELGMMVETIRPRFGRETILVVDSHATLRSITRDLLSSWGYRVHFDTNAAVRVDVAIMDVVSLSEEAWTLLREIRHQAAHVIVSTALPRGRAHDQLIRAGAGAIIAKPINPVELACSVRAVLRN